jgi:AAA+ ATPase superfamily predicted ATPase
MPPIFVNRAREMDEFETLLEDLDRGHRRHLALLGLRRIGKTMLFDEVRRRHPGFAIAYLALDDVVSSPETFARSLVGQILATAAARKGLTPSLLRTEDALLEMAALDPRLVALVKEIIVWMEKSDYGELLISTMRFPGHLSEILDIPLLVMLDEFQDITRLRDFPGTANLLGTVRAALDRQGRVGFAVAGSRVTALRKLIGASESPLFTRFGTISLDPFGLEATEELATRTWEEEGVSNDPDAVARLYRLSGGWPFYISAIAQKARQVARAGDCHITPDTIDLAFREEIFGRVTTIGQHCTYLRATATEDSSRSEKSLLEELLEQVALRQPLTRANLVRRLARHYSQKEIYRGVNRLIDTDFLAEQNGVLTLLDPIFALWLAAEPARQDPQTLLTNQAAVQKLISWYEQRHSEDRATMGMLFEKRVENLVRQFAGQEVDGKLFGTIGTLSLPTVRQLRRGKVDDPKGLYGKQPDSYELEVVTTGDAPADCWGIEAKHRRGAVTKAMVERFLENARAIEKAEGLTFSHLWIVTNRGIRADAIPLIQTEAILTSGSRQIEKLERLAAARWKPE